MTEQGALFDMDTGPGHEQPSLLLDLDGPAPSPTLDLDAEVLAPCPACGLTPTHRLGEHTHAPDGHPIYGSECSAMYGIRQHTTSAILTGDAEWHAELMVRADAHGMDRAEVDATARAAATHIAGARAAAAVAAGFGTP